MCRVAVYLRVSTAAQGQSGLGLEAQREAVSRLCALHGWEVTAEFTEVESGRRSDRPQLRRALQEARTTGAKVVVAKADRLSRDVKFLLTLVDSGAEVLFGDLPTIPPGAVGRFMLTAMTAAAELEAGLASERTKAALAAAKARGCKADGTPFKAGRLGNPNGAAAFRRAGKGNAAAVAAVRRGAGDFATSIAHHVRELQGAGVRSLPQLAKGLNDRGVVTPRGGRWHPSSVSNLLRRIEAGQPVATTARVGGERDRRA